MRTTVSDFLLQRLSEWGIKRIFGFPGDGVIGKIGAVCRAGAKVDHQSVLATVGQQARMAMGGSYQQGVDLISAGASSAAAARLLSKKSVSGFLLC